MKSSLFRSTERLSRTYKRHPLQPALIQGFAKRPWSRYKHTIQHAQKTCHTPCGGFRSRFSPSRALKGTPTTEMVALEILRYFHRPIARRSHSSRCREKPDRKFQENSPEEEEEGYLACYAFDTWYTATNTAVAVEKKRGRGGGHSRLNGHFSSW